MNEAQMTLGVDWQGQDVTGWYLSEKLNGCRAYYDGERFWTRGGNVVDCPKWFMRGLPQGVPLDGEIYAGVDGLQEASNAVRFGGRHFTKACRFYVFDAPGEAGNWPERMTCGALHAGGAVRFVPITVCRSMEHLRGVLAAVQRRGGEGIMLRNPTTVRYEAGRTRNLLKVKPDFLP
jgi:DNA ligase-1